MVDQKKYGQLAMELISHYPLYASTSGITYDEAIEIAKIIYPDVKDWERIIEEDL